MKFHGNYQTIDEISQNQGNKSLGMRILWKKQKSENIRIIRHKWQNMFQKLKKTKEYQKK